MTDGSINNDNIAKAIMQYCNTPLPNVSLSSAHTLFHRELHDFTLSHPTHHQLHKGWIASQEQREYIAAKQNIKHTERYNTMAHALQPLPLGTPVLIQNTGNHLQHSKKWDKTGVITEVLPDRQFHICLDGSGSITLRNRQFLRPYHKLRDIIIIPSATYHIMDSTHAIIQITPSPTPSSTPTPTPPPPVPLPEPPQSPTPLPPPLPTNPNVSKIPQLLKKLAPHNKTGLKEQPLTMPRKGDSIYAIMWTIYAIL